MKRYFSILSMICVFAFAGIAGTVAQVANPAADFEYDLNTNGDGVVIQKYKGTATNVVIPAVIEDFPVVEVNSFAFARKNVVSVVFPDSVTEIGSSCFEGCNALQKVVLPKNLKYISVSLFKECMALKAITLPDSIEEIRKRAFEESGLESITIPDSVKRLRGDIRYGTPTVGAFENCENLHTVTIGNGTEFIGEGSFLGCTNLTTVTIGNGIQYIGHAAFSQCSSLKTVNFGVEKLPKGSFIEVEGHSYPTGYTGIVFGDCSALSLKEQQKIRNTGYTGRF